MCTKSSGCLCHHLEIAIKKDDKKKLKVIFDSYYIDELYNFLLDAYEVIETLDGHKFATRMDALVKNYLLEKSPNSINVTRDRIREDFMDIYDEKIDDLISAKSSLKEKLIPLIQDVQHLAYQNLSSIDSVNSCLEKIDNANAIDMEDTKSHKRRGCTIL